MTDPLYNPGPHPELPDGCTYREIDGKSEDDSEEEGNAKQRFREEQDEK